MSQEVLKQYVAFARVIRDHLSRHPSARQDRLMFLYNWLLARGVLPTVATAKIASDFDGFTPTGS
jgi:hypothetical protein